MFVVYDRLREALSYEMCKTLFCLQLAFRVVYRLNKDAAWMIVFCEVLITLTGSN